MKTLQAIIALYLCLHVAYGQANFNCNNFSKISNLNNGFLAGKIDISGSKLTVEAIINNQGPNAGTNSNSSQEIVSKHHTPSNVNYLLRMNHAEITTTRGFYKTDDVCSLIVGQTYHIAMTYDGVSLSFYRNGNLVNKVSCSGDLITNDLITTIGTFAAQDFDNTNVTQAGETFNGYINEVRIWNIARTQSQLFEYKDKPLDNPQNINGLLAYYQFNDLKNKTGNANFDLKLLGNPQLNQTPPSCTFGVDPCKQCNINPSFTSVQDKCNPAKFNFANTTKDVSNFAWIFQNNGVTNSTDAETDYTFSGPGSYFVLLNVSDNSGCSSNVGYTVTVPEIPKAIATNQQELCSGASIELTSNYTETGTKYTWSPANIFEDNSIGNPKTTITENTTVSLNLVTPQGCERSGTVDLNVISPNTFAVNPSNISMCTGKSATFTASGGGQYIWKSEDGTIIGQEPAITLDPTASQTYSVEITSTRCDVKSDLNTTIKIFPVEDISLVQTNPISCLNTTTSIIVNGGVSTIWTPSETLTSNGKNAIVEPLKSETYTAIVNDKNGCIYNKSITIITDLNANNSKFFIPSAFSPNGDGKNDIFRIRTNITLSRYQLRVFNRYGQLVFQSQDKEKGWDGKLNNNLQQTGTFIYEVMATSKVCGEFHKKGTIVLIR